MGERVEQQRRPPGTGAPQRVAPGVECAQRPSPVRDGEWVGTDGTRWRLRGAGGQLPVKRVARLLRSPEVGVLLFSGPGAPTEVRPEHREALWQRMRPHLREPVVRAPGDHADFRAAEFRDDRRRSLLVVEESC